MLIGKVGTTIVNHDCSGIASQDNQFIPFYLTVAQENGTRGGKIKGDNKAELQDSKESSNCEFSLINIVLPGNHYTNTRAHKNGRLE